MRPGYFCPATERMIAVCVGSRLKRFPKGNMRSVFP